MKKAFNKLVFIAISLFVVISVSVFPTLAATYVQDGDWKYQVVGDHIGYYIESYIGTSSRVSIPSLFQGKYVTKVNSDAFLNNTTVQYVSIPATVETIGMNAFYGCTALKTLTVPAELQEIGNNAFYGCTSLVMVTFESNPSVKTVPRNCFNACSSLQTVVMTQGMERIDSLAFNGCTALKSAIIPSSVTYIADDAFEGCDSLVIKGWEDTYVQQYAEQNGISFYSYGVYVEPTTVPETTAVPDSTVEPDTSAATPSENVTTPDETISTTVPEVSDFTSSVPSQSDTTQSTTSQKTTYLIGDSDLDYKITVKDATLIQKYAADLVTLQHNQRFLANCDGVQGINVKDATQIQKYCAGFLNILFVGTEVEI